MFFEGYGIDHLHSKLFPMHGTGDKSDFKQIESKLNKYFNQVRSNSLIYWFHCSSYGEYLQIDPVIEGIKKKKINSIILLSFFSPSGYDLSLIHI